MTADRRVVVIGGGIAGLSCAANVAASRVADVVVLEAESQPGYHSSGRSAAVYIEPYMNATIFGLSRASLDFFLDPPSPFWSQPIVESWQSLMIASEESASLLDPYVERWAALCPELHEIPVEDALARVPIVRPEAVARAMVDPRAMRIDVHGLLDGFRRMLLAGGGTLETDARVTAIEKTSGGWRVRTERGREREADVLVDAAGAWGDQIGELAGVGRLGLQPLRRTAMLIGTEGHDIQGWPMLYDVGSTFYLKPETGQLLLSPSDENPSPPCDAQPEDFDVALAVDRIQRVTRLEVPRIEQRWAGLRSFLPDDVPAVGFDPDAPGFFWLIGQGGFGMQSSGAMGRLSAALLAGEPVPSDIADLGVDPDVLSPTRLRT